MSVYELLYRGGFGLTDSMPSLAYLMEHNNNLEIVESISIEKAYVDCCIKYVEKKLQLDPYSRPLLPKFEHVLQTPFHEPGFVEHVPPVRFFAMLNKNFIGVFSSTEKALEFLNVIHPTWLREFSNQSEAVAWCNYQIMRCILPLSAYCSGNISYIKSLPLDTAVPIPYIQWLAEHYHPEPRLTFGNNFLLELQAPSKAEETVANESE